MDLPFVANPKEIRHSSYDPSIADRTSGIALVKGLKEPSHGDRADRTDSFRSHYSLHIAITRRTTSRLGHLLRTLLRHVGTIYADHLSYSVQVSSPLHFGCTHCMW